MSPEPYRPVFRGMHPVRQAAGLLVVAASVVLLSAMALTPARADEPGPTPTVTPTPAPAPGSKIVFSSDRGPNYNEIVTVNIDGSGLTQLSQDAAIFASLAWSPDGARIAYETGPDLSEIVTVGADGPSSGPGSQVNLTNHPGYYDHPAWSPDGSRIAYVARTEDAYEIFVMNADGTNQVNLTHNHAVNDWPVWSPDGTRIAFGSSMDGNYEIYIMNADPAAGAGLVRVTNDPNWDSSPTWSPDGKRIAFVSSRASIFDDIYVVTVDGSTPPGPDDIKRLTADAKMNMRPAWSPDGRRIAFVSNRDGSDNIYLMNPDGANLWRLTYNASATSIYSLAWSPDGGHLAYRGGTDLADDNAYVINADGSGKVRVSPYGVDSDPVWSPDSRRVAFSSRFVSRANLYMMDADGSNVTRLTTTRGGLDTYPAWSPDGKRIAFNSDRDGNYEIYVMNADPGSGQTNLTHSGATNDLFPVWSPDGKRIAFYSNWAGGKAVNVMNADGTGLYRLADNAVDPVWSPDGTRIAFVSERDGAKSIYIANRDGSGRVRLTDSPGAASDPAWSPDGTRIAFAFAPDGMRTQIAVMEVGRIGSPIILTNSEFSTANPEWSPDGTRIAFSTTVTIPSPYQLWGEIHVMNADGSGLHRVANNVSSTLSDLARPAWSPDGTRILYQSDYVPETAVDIYVVNADGSGLVNLTNYPRWDQHPAWLP